MMHTDPDTLAAQCQLAPCPLCGVTGGCEHTFHEELPMSDEPKGLSMEFKDYENGVAETAVYPASGEFGGLLYTVIALCGETGEVANKVKKVIRDDHGILLPNIQAQLVDELGDVLWYVARMAAELNVSLEDVAQANLTKIRRRLAEKKIHGSGDNR